MIKVDSAVQQDKIIETLNNFDKEDIQFIFKEKQGITLFFETNADNFEKASKLAKSAIKDESWGSVLYFQVTPAN